MTMKSGFIRFAIFIGLFVHGSYQHSNETHYIAAVVEFSPFYAPIESNEIPLSNSEAYEKIITSKEAEPADIIVFPESTLNVIPEPTFVPKVEDHISPCDFPKDYAWYLVGISCKAREAKKYVVINLTSKEKCTKESQDANNDTRPCALNGLSIYNTNVVFDRNGTVISTYRKFHLYGEPGKNTTKTPDMSTFDTDFGVTFGHFVCFDILFQSPALDLVKHGITDFAFPTMWFSELPFLTAVQSQMAWAYANDVNVLAANSGFPSVGSTGTGIYAGREGLITGVNNEHSVRNVYIGAVPKKDRMGRRIKPTQVFERPIESTEHLNLKIDKAIQEFDTEIISSTVNTTQKFHVCSKDFCCDFEIKKHSKMPKVNEKSYEFRVGVFNGFRWFEDIDRTYLRVCGVFACTNSSVESCGATFATKKTTTPVSDIFEDIRIDAKFPKAKTMLIQPTGVHRNLLPVPTQEMNYKVNDRKKFYDVSLKTWNRTNLLTFGIFTNYYTNSASNVIGSSVLGRVFTLFNNFVNRLR